MIALLVENKFTMIRQIYFRPYGLKFPWHYSFVGLIDVLCNDGSFSLLYEMQNPFSEVFPYFC